MPHLTELDLSGRRIPQRDLVSIGMTCTNLVSLRVNKYVVAFGVCRVHAT